MMTTDKRCGTCKWFGAAYDGADMAQCLWDKPHPMWLSENADKWVGHNWGEDCPTWEPST